ncbi:MAG: RICIN domain-containing protein [Spirosomaceae bacterium]|nr:RICIN domain-containing protein [Spirosomataceae bacterium]
MRKLFALLLFWSISVPLLAQGDYIQVHIQQECVDGKNKLKILPISPTQNIGDFSYDIEPFIDFGDDYLCEVIRTDKPNEFYIKEPPRNKHANFYFKVRRAGYADFSLRWYVTTCDHDGNPIYCPENNRTIRADKTYHTTGESFKLTYEGCPKATLVIMDFIEGSNDRPNIGDYLNRLQRTDNTVSGIVPNQPFLIGMFCGGQGECHGYTSYTITPDGYSVRSVPGGFVKLKNFGSGKYVGFDSGKDNIVQYSQTDEAWKFEKVEEPNVYRIVSQKTSKSLEAIANWGATSLRNSSNSELQKWLVTFYNDGSVRIRPKVYPNNILNVESESNDEGRSMYATNNMPNKSLDYFKYSFETGGQNSSFVISTNNPNKTTFTVGEGMSVDFQTGFAPNRNTEQDCGTFDRSIFELQLSDANGSFNNPKTLAVSIINNNGGSSGTFNTGGFIPADTPAGGNYKVRVNRTQVERTFTRTVSQNCSSNTPVVINADPIVLGSANPTAITIQAVVAPPPGCPEDLDVSFTLDAATQDMTKEAKQITSKSVVKNGAKLNLKASKAIDLQDGFDAKADTGGHFDANLNGCKQ